MRKVQQLLAEFDLILSEMNLGGLLLDDADADAKADADAEISILCEMNRRDGRAAAALAEKLSLVICAPNISFPDFAFVNPAGKFNKINA